MPNTVQSTKRISKEMKIQNSKIKELFEKYDIFPVDFSLTSSSTEKFLLSNNEEMLPEKLILSGQFILKLRS